MTLSGHGDVRLVNLALCDLVTLTRGAQAACGAADKAAPLDAAVVSDLGQPLRPSWAAT